MVSRILDRQRYGDFLKAYLICFVSLVGLYIVIDAFTNFDEFTKVVETTPELFAYMGRFYLIRMSAFYDQLCGVITIMAAAFTITWMQRNNELIAMLSAGLSAHRVVRPVIVSATLVSLLSIANQELIMPRFSKELLRSAADDGSIRQKVYSRFDRNQILIYGDSGVRQTQTVRRFAVKIPESLHGTMQSVDAEEARYIPDEVEGVPYRGGWLLRGARMSPNEDDANEPDLFVLTPEEVAAYSPPIANPEVLAKEGPYNLFLKTNVSFASISQSRRWYQFASTPHLIEALHDPSNGPERANISVFLHGRLLRPVLNITLLMLSLPFILGGLGRNMFLNLGIALATSAVFYAVGFFAQFLGTSEVIDPELSAWLPFIVFGTLATANWGGIRT